MEVRVHDRGGGARGGERRCFKLSFLFVVFVVVGVFFFSVDDDDDDGRDDGRRRRSQSSFIRASTPFFFLVPLLEVEDGRPRLRPPTLAPLRALLWRGPQARLDARVRR